MEIWPDELQLTAIDEAESPDEQMGSKEKRWVELPGDSRLWLVKTVRGSEVEGDYIRGEDWAEWLVHQVAQGLGVPSATILPASFDGKRAIASRSVLHHRAEQLVEGNRLMAAAIPEYDSEVGRGNYRLYTPENVQATLAEVVCPREFSGPDWMTAFGVWAGYLVLDALVAGRDRHHENWAAVRYGEHNWLAPSYDHGNAFGNQERNEQVSRILDRENGVATWVRRGRSPHFYGKPSLVDLAIHALRLAAPLEADYWVGQVESINLDQISSVVHTIPEDRMSDPARRFAYEIIRVNRGRLLSEVQR